MKNILTERREPFANFSMLHWLSGPLHPSNQKLPKVQGFRPYQNVLLHFILMMLTSFWQISFIHISKEVLKLGVVNHQDKSSKCSITCRYLTIETSLLHSSLGLTHCAWPAVVEWFHNVSAPSYCFLPDNLEVQYDVHYNSELWAMYLYEHPLGIQD